MDVAKGATEEFVTVVSVGNQPAPENFVTVLSIGSGKKDDDTASTTLLKSQPNGIADAHLEEEVEVYRLPGEKLGFGLKFEGGNKTTERVRRLFVQSCAEQSPASRAKCSWGTLGEGDEVLSIDGVPVTHMTRLDCVRRLKESQLVIRLMVRCRGVLRPEVVSAERKTSPEKKKVPPELPSAPPPVPPRKLRQPRGSADGEANPSPVKKSWDTSRSQSNSQNGSQNSSPSSQTPSLSSASKSTTYDSCESSPKSMNGSTNQESPKGTSPKERSPDLKKSKQQEPPEAMVYLDARSQCGSTHGSTSDDTGSSLSTVVDRFSTSDRVSTISTVSTASTTSEQQPGEYSRVDQDFERNSDQLSRSICSFEHFDGDFSASPPDYLLRRLASSEEVTHVESRGEVERITAVVAPNTVLIEETITFQPPLSFQDAPLSYGHEARPDLFYTADLAADSTTHFRPIKDDAELVERVNGDHQEFHATETSPSAERSKDTNGGATDKTPPPLPARNHVNRIAVNQNDNQNEPRPRKLSDTSTTESPEDVPVLPPKPLPRKDVKIRRKRPPPPPPPPTIAPRRDVKPPPLPESRQTSSDNESNTSRMENNGINCIKKVDDKTGFGGNVKEERPDIIDARRSSEQDKSARKNVDENDDHANNTKVIQQNEDEDFDDFDFENSDGSKTNKVLEIIEIRKARALSPQKGNFFEGNQKCLNDKERVNNIDQETVKVTVNSERPKDIKSTVTISTEFEDSEEEAVLESIDSASNGIKLNNSGSNDSGNGSGNENPDFRENGLSSENSLQRESEDDETYKSLDEINDDLKNSEANRMVDDDDTVEEDDTTDESDDGDYYWQSNLATIGEEEETNSLEYASANKEISDVVINLVEKPEVPEESTEKDVFSVTARNDEIDSTNQLADFSETEAKKLTTEAVNGRMENCGGGQRLPPDGDEFPAAYQEFGSNNSNGNQQYRFVSAAKSSTMTTNGGLVCGENESFVGPERTFKLLEGNVVSTRSIILPDNRVTLSNVDTACQETNGKAEINGKLGVSIVENLGRDNDLPTRERRNDDAKSAYNSEDFVKKNIAVTTYSTYGNQSNSNVVVSEKKIEITGYYHKDVTPVIDEVQEQEKETVVDTPPPLPLTGPPKIEATYTKTVQNLEQPQRKFSLNGELWRQDDKSERSVRDKIAMFSSQNSLDTPLFPSTATVTSVTSNGRRLSKYKSSEDVCNDEKSPCQKEKNSFFADRTQSSFDLTDSTRNANQDTDRKYIQRSPSFTQSTSVKTAPIVPQKPTSPFDKHNVPNTPTKSYCTTTLSQNSGAQNNGANRNQNSSNVPLKPVTSTTLARATSFSGSTPYGQDRNSTTNDLYSSVTQISRTNSLASTFRKPSEEIRRASLNQLIEQRRRSISKLRGLVIPEKEAVPIDQPIVDLPEIKSRDSILLHQISKVNIQDKWGSQSSLASNTSTASAPLKATTSFKMAAPQIHSKYSPAFKRKSLTVYGTSVTSSSINGTAKASQTSSTPTSTTTTFSEPPKSLESICSPTRSDYSFEFVSASGSPEGSRSRPRTVHRKTRMDYDDSDNDSAVSSSQSSISRGFSPPMSPVPSERSTVSSERSYVSTETNYQRQSLIMSSPTRTYNREVIADYSARTSNLGERTYISERSSSSSGGSNPRSPQPTEMNSRNSQIPQRQLRRSNSTDTNCSTSSTLTSGSQASAESLSRRVLKPQSVEAINRKNILASARCRSGRDLNGSPLIQRKFSDDEDTSGATQNGSNIQRTNHGKNVMPGTQDVKIAYIEVTDPFVDDETYQNPEEPKLPPKRSIPLPAARPPKSEMLEPSNDLKMWVRAEAKALARSAEEKTAKIEKSVVAQDIEISSKVSTSRNSRQSMLEEQVRPMNVTPANRNLEEDCRSGSVETSKQRPRLNVTKKAPEDPNDLLTILTTKSRSRSAIHVDEGAFGRSKSQMSLEDILSAKTEVKLSRAQSIEGKVEKNGILPGAVNRSTWESKDNRYGRRSSMTSNDSWSEERPFVSKIPTLGRSKLADSGDEMTEVDRSKSTLSKIPTARNLGRRSASVTDMKKALEKNDVNSSSSNQHQAPSNTHNRFPSLDSSVDENICPIGADGDTDRCCSEQFGSISSLASSTSLISQQELAQLVEEASLEEARGAHDVVVVLLHKENPTGSVGITLAGGADCEVKEITVHRVLAHSIADKDGRVQRGDRILSINGRSTRGLTHRESLTVLKQPRSEVVLVVSRARLEEGCKLRSRTASVETIIEGFETNGSADDTAWGPPSVVAVYKDGAGLGFSLEGGRDSPLGDRPLVIKKIFTGGAAEKTGALKAGDQLLEVNGSDVTRMSRIEAWSLMKKLHDGEVNLLVRHPATKSS